MAFLSPVPVPPTLHAVLFDLDGTLIETHIDFPRMTRAMETRATEAGVPVEMVRGKDILNIVAAAADEITRHGGDGDAYRQASFAVLEEMETAGCARPRLLPGTHDLLAHLCDARIKIGIVTRNCRRVSKSLVSQFSLPHDILLTRDDVVRTKPDPHHLWDALEALSCAPQEAAMVGDHWMDIQAGKQAGCAVTIGVLGGHAAEWFAPCPPAAMVKDLQDALPLLLPRPVMA